MTTEVQVSIPGTGLCFATPAVPGMEEWLKDCAAAISQEIRKLTIERDAARANAQVFMEQRDAAVSRIEQLTGKPYEPKKDCPGCGGTGRICDHKCPACQP